MLLPGIKPASQQKGVVFPILLILIALGVLTFLFFSRTAFFHNLKSSRTVKAVAYSPKVLLVVFNPIIESQGGQKLTQLKGWNDPDGLTSNAFSELLTNSGSLANYTIAEKIELDEIPVNKDGFQYTDEGYLECANSGGSACHSPDGADYLKILAKVGACEKRNSGAIDEVWMWGGPWFGFWESNLTGPGSFWYNSDPTTGTTCEKPLPIMGFNYERGLNEMFEGYAHRVEATMKQVYSTWEPKYTHNWNKFALLDADVPGQGGCGNAHLAVNSPSNTGYNTTDTRTVKSQCDDFLNYPNVSGNFKDTSCTAWGCSPAGYYKWWYSHLPKNDGVGPDGRLNSWWTYILDPQKANEPPQGVFSNLSAQLLDNDATFNFIFSGTSNGYKIDISTLPDMSWDVYLDFASGASSPVTINNTQTRWDKYRCDKTLYWRAYTQDRSIKSDIQTSTVTCSVMPSPTQTPDTTPPEVSITSPLDNSTVKKGSTQTITASASDNSGLRRVEFLINNTLYCTDWTTPYTCAWKVPAKPRVKYLIEAKAVDTSANFKSSKVTVTSQ